VQKASGTVRIKLYWGAFA